MNIPPTQPDPNAQSWILVAETPFMPARAGGEVEQLGIALAAQQHGTLGAVVLPVDPPGAPTAYDDEKKALMERTFPGVPVFEAPRQRSLRAALRPTRPYVTESRPTTPSLAAAIRTQVPEATGVFAISYKSHHLGAHLADELNLPLVVRTHNLEGRYHHALAAGQPLLKRIAYHLEALRIEIDERINVERNPRVAMIMDISETDADRRKRRAKRPVTYVPTFAGLAKDPPAGQIWSSPAEPVVIFLGSLDVRTNYDALHWMLTQVWPMVLRQCPQATFHVVGRRPSPEVEHLVEQTDHTILLADVKDPIEHLTQARVAVNPTVSGSGLNIKLIDYLAAGTPVVTTSRGVQGLGLRTHTDVMVADSPAEFAQHVVQLLTDDVEARRLSKAGAARVLALRDVGPAVAEISKAFQRPSA